MYLLIARTVATAAVSVDLSGQAKLSSWSRLAQFRINQSITGERYHDRQSEISPPKRCSVKIWSHTVMRSSPVDQPSVRGSRLRGSESGRHLAAISNCLGFPKDSKLVISRHSPVPNECCRSRGIGTASFVAEPQPYSLTISPKSKAVRSPRGLDNHAMCRHPWALLQTQSREPLRSAAHHKWLRSETT